MTGMENDRNQQIIRYNLMCIGINLVLAVLKLTAGTIISSKAIFVDGVNSLSDMLSSLISIVSANAAGRKSDKMHPLGYGRLEYLSSLFVTVLIMYTGARSVVGAVKEILHPENVPNYTTFAILIMATSVVLKLINGLILRRAGKRLSCIALTMTGTDSMCDSLISVGILAGIAAFKVFHWNLEPCLCILISLMIFFTGVAMLRECMHKIIGSRPDPDYKKKIKQALIMEEGVLHVSNLIIHNYGEKVNVGSVDIEVDENMSASDVTRLSRKLIRKAGDLGLTLTSIGITGSPLSDPRAAKIWDTILYETRKHDGILQAMLFTVDFQSQVVSFYVVPDYSRKDRSEIIQRLQEDLERLLPHMKIEILQAIDV